MRSISLFAPRLLLLLLLFSVTVIYLNHFNNSFHFDDSHAVENNIFIQDISNIPRFFVDATTMSVLPLNQSYRPLVTTTLAFDYWLAGDLDPFFFHLSTFIVFLFQLYLMYLLFAEILRHTGQEKPNQKMVSLFLTACYGLHPVSAETVNYIVQRAEVYTTLGVIAALLVYIHRPKLRRFGLYLLPMIIGSLAKPLSLVFAPILFMYILLFEKNEHCCVWDRTISWKSVLSAFWAALPSFIICLLLLLFQALMTPETYTPGGTSLARYIFTQPLVHLHYFRSLLLPITLSADTDWPLLSYGDPLAYLGFTFYFALAALICSTSRSRIYRPVAFGLFWFICALLPTSVIPLAEVMNDHRMYFPFVGLVLAIGWPLCLLAKHLVERIPYAARAFVLTFLALIVLAPYAYGTYQRNEVWQSEETLWKDAVEKSPKNGRAYMNYGLALMATGDYSAALRNFEQALVFTPNYSTLEVNLGVATSALGQREAAEKHFRRALLLAPHLASSYFYYARWLNEEERTEESIALLEQGMSVAPDDFDIRHLLMGVYFQRKEWAKLKALSKDSLRIAAADEFSLEINRIADEAVAR